MVAGQVEAPYITCMLTSKHTDAWRRPGENEFLVPGVRRQTAFEFRTGWQYKA